MIDIRICPNGFCKKEAEIGDFFCSRCGRKLPVENPNAWPGKLIEISEESNFEFFIFELRKQAKWKERRPLREVTSSSLLQALRIQTDYKQQILARKFDLDGNGRRFNSQIAVEGGTRESAIPIIVKTSLLDIRLHLLRTVTTGP